MTTEQEVISSRPEKGLLEEMVVFALKPGSFIEATQDTIKRGGDDFKQAIYPGLVILETARLGAYTYGAYCIGDVLAKYFS